MVASLLVTVAAPASVLEPGGRLVPVAVVIPRSRRLY